MRKPPFVPPTLDYLIQLREAGDPPVDIRIIGENEDLWAATVTLQSGEEQSFLIQTDVDTISAHGRAAVEFTGFGPWGLKQNIYRDVFCNAREAGRKMCDFKVILSSNRAESLPDYIISHLSNYEFEVKVADIPELYQIRLKLA